MIMDCPNCGTWNPDDKDICWRCQTELPKPVEKKKKRKASFAGLPLWLWAIGIFFILASFFGQCLRLPAMP